jgi:hypothetical protein
MIDEVKISLSVLRKYCEKEVFKGWDPYDGLNSKIFRAIPLVKDKRLSRLIWIQVFKKSPLNLRPLLLIPKEYNPKGLGLFLSGYCLLYKQDSKEEFLQKIKDLIEQVLALRSEGWSGACWGYNFDWQSKAFFQAKYSPSVVVSAFIANALLDAYEITNNEQLLKTARSTCSFILKDLNRTNDTKGNFCFSYSPLDKTVVFNASLLGSRLLSRVYHFTREKELLEGAKKSVAFCCSYQRQDGSWTYGTHPIHNWVDNFHTGYNLECMADYMKYSEDYDYEIQLAQGFNYYINTFFSKEGISKYYNNSTFPIDIHAPAQMVITLAKLNKFQEHKDLLNNVLLWTIKHMQSDKGYFYYQVNKYFTTKIPYMRWAQAWMFYALSTYLLNSNKKNE